jgi:hypothetical protein
MIKIPKKLKDKLWWLVISVDYDYSRITIAEHEIDEDILTMWLEDKQDFKNSLDECLKIDIPAKQLAKVIKTENLNSYEGAKMHPTKNFIYKTRIEINDPINWYRDDASTTEQQWAREAVLRLLLTELVETEAIGIEPW